MVITVTPNLAIDKTYLVPGFASVSGGHVTYRSSEMRSVAGGKGINVARVLRTLGRDALATGFAGGHNGDFICACLDYEGISHDFERVEGESRVCVTIVDPLSGSTVDVNEDGPLVSAQDCEGLLSRVASYLGQATHLVLSGSVPPGVPGDFYARAVTAAKSAGVTTVLDASGEHLRLGVQAGPDVVKPNLAELSQCVGRELTTLGCILEAASSLARFGTRLVIVTMGDKGAIAVAEDEAWHATPPPIEFVSAVGSGDALAAGLVSALLSGADVPEALRTAVATGTANAAQHGAGFCTADSIASLTPLVGLERVSPGS